MKRSHIILVVVLGLIAFACKQVIDHQEDKLTTTVAETLKVVQVAEVESVQLSHEVYAIGRLASKEEAKLSFKTGGMIKRILVSEGQTVQAGALLAELDLEEINAQVQQAQVGNSQAQITLKNARLQVEKLERDYETVKALYEDRVATLTELKDTKSLLDNAQNQVEAALTGLDFSSENQKIAAYNQKLSKIRAPSAGIILKQLAESNEIVGPGTPVFFFGSKKEALALKTNVTDKDVVHLEIGNKATIKFDAHPGKSFEGVVSEIAGIADQFTGTYEVEITLPRTKEKLLSGFIGEATISSDNEDQYLTIPIDAMIRANGNMALVYTVENGLVQSKSVRVGPIQGTLLIIYDGLLAGEKVITRGAEYVSPNDSVNVEIE